MPPDGRGRWSRETRTERHLSKKQIVESDAWLVGDAELREHRILMPSPRRDVGAGGCSTIPTGLCYVRRSAGKRRGEGWRGPGECPSPPGPGASRGESPAGLGSCGGKKGGRRSLGGDGGSLATATLFLCARGEANLRATCPAASSPRGAAMGVAGSGLWRARRYAVAGKDATGQVPLRRSGAPQDGGAVQ